MSSSSAKQGMTLSEVFGCSKEKKSVGGRHKQEQMSPKGKPKGKGQMGKKRDDSPDVTEALNTNRRRSSESVNFLTSESSSGSGSGGSVDNACSSDDSSDDGDELYHFLMSEVKNYEPPSGCRPPSHGDQMWMEVDEECASVSGSSTSSAAFPPQLDFMGSDLELLNNADKSKRRTDRYDSSESSDSGVATLSPSTSDSTELISSPYSPCCDLSSDASSTISSNGSPSSSSSSSSLCGGVSGGTSTDILLPSSILSSVSPPPPTLHPQVQVTTQNQNQLIPSAITNINTTSTGGQIQQISLLKPTSNIPTQHQGGTPATLLGHPIMTAVSAVLAAAGDSNSNQNSKQFSSNHKLSSSSSAPVTNFISFQIPNANTNVTTPIITNTTGNTNGFISKGKGNRPLAKKEPSVSSVSGSTPTSKPISLNCDAIRPLLAANSNSKVSATSHKQKSSVIPPPISKNSKSPATPTTNSTTGGSTTTGGGTIKNIFAAALSFHQQQQKQQKEIKEQKQKDANNINNNNNSTTINKNHNNINTNTKNATTAIAKTVTKPTLTANSTTTTTNNTDLKKSNSSIPSSIKPSPVAIRLSKTTTPIFTEERSSKAVLLSGSKVTGSSSSSTSIDLQLQSQQQLIKKSLTNILSKSASLSNAKATKKARLNSNSSVVETLPLSSNNKNNKSNKTSLPSSDSVGLSSKGSSLNSTFNNKSSANLLPASAGPKKTENSPQQTQGSSSMTVVAKKLIVTGGNIVGTSPNSKVTISCKSALSSKRLSTSMSSMSMPTSLSKSHSGDNANPSGSKNRLKRKLQLDEPEDAVRKFPIGNPIVDSSSESKKPLESQSQNNKRKSFGSSLVETVSVSGSVNSSLSVVNGGLTLGSCNSSLTSNIQTSSSSSFSVSASNSVVGALPLIKAETVCMWKGCKVELSLNILEHIQTGHVAGQVKSDGYVCLWEGCKVYNKKSSSLSWLERHVLSHSGNKPFKCIFPGCGQSFGVQGALERHVNSHISTNGSITGIGPHGTSTMKGGKLDSSPLKGSRRKKQRCRKQRLNIGMTRDLGQYVDYFDKRVMEVIKHRLATSMDFHTVSAHDCTFRGQVVARRTAPNKEPQVLVHWFPESIIADEWMLQKEYKDTKLVPLTRIEREKLPLLYPTLFPSERREKASRKVKSYQTSYTSSSSAASSSGSMSSGIGSSSPMTFSSSTPSPSWNGSEGSEVSEEFSSLKSEFLSEFDEEMDEGIGSCSSSSRKSSRRSNHSNQTSSLNNHHNHRNQKKISKSCGCPPSNYNNNGKIFPAFSPIKEESFGSGGGESGSEGEEPEDDWARDVLAMEDMHLASHSSTSTSLTLSS